MFLLPRSFLMGIASLLLLFYVGLSFPTTYAQPESRASSGSIQYLPLVLQQQEEPDIPPPSQRIPFLMGMPPNNEICNYEVISLRRDALLPPEGFNGALLEEAHRCGTKVIVRLHGLSQDVANPDGGIDLVVYEDQINDFAGLIDPYVENGTIIGHMTVDEPHDCSDWNNLCPTRVEVDQASAISKRYWPTLRTIVNTIPTFAAPYTWTETDEISFTYAFHKGPIATFISNVQSLLNAGRVRSISWAMQVVEGGCDTYNACSMSPQQVLDIGTAMCDTGNGSYVGFFRYNTTILTAEMKESISALRAHCAPGP